MADRYIIDFEKEEGFCAQGASFDQGLEKDIVCTLYLLIRCRGKKLLTSFRNRETLKATLLILKAVLCSPIIASH